MTAINDANDLLGLLSSGALSLDILSNLLTDGGAVASEMIYCHKAGTIAGVTPGSIVAQQPYSLWTVDGCPMSGGAVPTSWANPTNTTVGGLMQANPGGIRNKWIVSAVGNAMTGGMLVVYDRLGHMGGMSGTTITAQNVNGGSLGGITRYTSGAGNQLWLEIYTTIGATTTTVTVNYQDGTGTTQTSQATPFGGTQNDQAPQMIPISLAGGSAGVQGATSVTVLASTGTAGNFGVTIIHPLLYIPIAAPASAAYLTSFLNGPLPNPQTNACLAMMYIPCTNQFSSFDLFLTSVEA